MSIIEGIGDEVTHFFGVALLAIIGCLAWWTTNISDRPAIRTIVLLERRRIRGRLSNHTETVTVIEGSPTDVDLTEGESVEITEVAAVPTEETSETETPKPPEAGPSSDTSEARSEEEEDEEEEEEDQGIIIEAMDENADTVRRRRLNYYDSKGTSSQDESSAASNSRSKELDSNTNTGHSASVEEKQIDPKNENSIRIKLKYINDDLKLVDGSLQEKLGDFKRRHFQGEMSANKLVRLIFNGQVLQPDSVTLRNCGLFDNCVVHCLIHQNRQTPREESGAQSIRTEYYSTTSPNRPRQPNNNNTGREWDLGNFLFGIVSFILASAWYLRYVYAHLYTISATVGLTVLTAVFTIAIIGIYFPNIEQFLRTQRT